MKDYKRLLSYLGPYRRDLLIGALLVVVETFFELIIPVLMANLIDVGVLKNDLHYIVSKGLQMGAAPCWPCSQGCSTPALRPAAPTAGAPISVRPSFARCSATPSLTWTTLRPRPWLPA